MTKRRNNARFKVTLQGNFVKRVCIKKIIPFLQVLMITIPAQYNFKLLLHKRNQELYYKRGIFFFPEPSKGS